MEMGAQLGGDASEFRYRLWRQWDISLRSAVWVMLNPSTADAETDDPTIRKCIGFSQRLGLGSFGVVNLFALRSTDPRALKKAADPVGPDNDAVIETSALWAEKVIVAWGADPAARHHDRANVVLTMIAKRFRPGKMVYHLGLSKGGAPRHPLMLPYATDLQAALPLSLVR